MGWHLCSSILCGEVGQGLQGTAPPLPRTPSSEAPQAAGSLAGERLPPALLVVLNYSSEEALWLYCFHLLQKEQCLFSEAAIWSNRG